MFPSYIQIINASLKLMETSRRKKVSVENLSLIVTLLARHTEKGYLRHNDRLPLRPSSHPRMGATNTPQHKAF